MDDDARAVLLQLYEAMNARDITKFGALISSERALPIIIGTGGPDDWREGREAVLAAIEEQFRDYPTLQFQAGHMHSMVDGNVAWIAERPTISMPDGSSIVASHTAVFRREEGSWRLVSSHLSLAAPDEPQTAT
jgi:hypothetical protein